MDEVARFMDWDLQAIVKGISTSEEAPVAAAATIIDNNSPHHHQQDLFFNFHELSETTWVIDELEELYKPLYPVPENNSSISTVTSSLLAIPEEQVKVLKPPAASKSKRRKKNGKRRVKEVTEAEAYSDGWAWRKYGQKPIKGSPYPRSYYRCSSSKGCLCRKQVERSPLDPQVFIVTYTAAEHTHPQPTRRKYSSSGPTRNNNNNNNKNSTSSSMIIAAASSSRAVEDHGGRVRVPSVGDEEQSNNNRGEDADSGNWLQNIELEEELNGLDLDDQLLDFDGCGFMDTTFDDDTWFNSSIDLT